MHNGVHTAPSASSADVGIWAPATTEEVRSLMPERANRDHVLIARIAAAERWARTKDRAEATAPARRGLRARFERDVLASEPDVAPAELARRADDLLRAHMLRMSLKSAQNRRARRNRSNQ